MTGDIVRVVIDQAALGELLDGRIASCRGQAADRPVEIELVLSPAARRVRREDCLATSRPLRLVEP